MMKSRTPPFALSHAGFAASAPAAASAEVVAGHRVRIEHVDVGGRQFQLACPVAPDALCDTAATQARFEADEYMPYWAELWPAGVLLARHLLERPGRRRPGVALEIGCGLGLVSIAAAAAGWRVVATDYDADALTLARHNARRNGLDGVMHAVLDWRTPALGRQFSLILASDVLYERRWHGPVARLVAGALAADGEALICEPGRQVAEPFPACAGSAGLHVEATTLQYELANRQMSGVVYRLTRAS